MPSRNLFYLFLILNSLLLAFSAFGQTRTDFSAMSPEPVSESLVQQNISQNTSTFIGVVYPHQRFLLSLATNGLVDKVHVKEGDFVNQGDVLIELDQSIERIELDRLNALISDRRQLDSTRNRLNIQRQQVQSVRQLYEANRSVSLDELNNLRMAQSALEGELASLEVERIRAEFDLKIAEALIKQRTLLSPSDGFITQIRPKTGEWAQIGEPVLELVDTSSNYIRIHVNDAKASDLSLGKTVDFVIEGHHGKGQISFISPIADPASGLVEVKVSFDNPDNRLRPGLKADVKL
ncbi:MAG: efflux RND transporter periplasmic adaptor subunit [Oceanospirillales bacterium]|nr:MAG: efflux RND transporter periplasmic adaptor subunit [Oceanospirillales bacterium]